MRLRKEKDVSLITIEVQNDALIQATGEYNRTLTKEEIKFLKLYAKNKGLLYAIKQDGFHQPSELEKKE